MGDIKLNQDLAIGVMNIISAEEHLFFTTQKTDKDFTKQLRAIRDIRTKMMEKLIGETEGELWCTTKHLLSASMRAYEVGNKYLKDGFEKEGKEMHEHAFALYTQYYMLHNDSEETNGEDGYAILVKKIIDEPCCDE